MNRRSVRARSWAFAALVMMIPPSFGGFLDGAILPPSSSATEGPAQREGSVTGTVSDEMSRQPLGTVQVFIPGSGIGTVTGADGRYSLTGVPAGVHDLRFERIGFVPVTRTVQVVSGGSVSVDVSLRMQALSLDGLVVTGTAGGTQRRAVGNVVEAVEAAEVLEMTPATSVNQLIGSRTPGVTMLGAGGAVGAGTRIRIRGVGSMGLGNDPIVYIDGIRMDSQAGSGPTQRGGAAMSRLDDINPEDIESIEIIKGPAAATLYGTEASNGVVQIITKRGRSGAMTLDITTRVGTHWLWNPAGRQGLTWATDPATGQLHSYNVYEYEEEHGAGPIFGYGELRSYQANLSGGTDASRYFLSAGWNDETGVRPENWQERLSLRGNLDITLTETLNLKTSMGYVSGTTRLASGGFNNDPMSNIFWASPLPSRIERNRGFFRAPPEEWGKIEDRSEIGRFTGSFELNYRPWGWFTHRLITGLDVSEQKDSGLTPRQPEGRAHYFGNDALGTRSLNHGTGRFVTLDYAASATRDLTDRLNSVTSFGLQYYKMSRHNQGSSGTELPAPQMTTVSAAANRLGTETLIENATVGVFVQQQMGWNNRLFFTAAVRADDNSAFGSEFDAAIYPKASATWVVHEEDFWTVDWMTQFRLRGAWGVAGKQPGTFDAAQLLSPQIGYDDQPTLLPNSFGNPTLKPERGSELELGFDAEFFGGRIGMAYTRFERTVTDAIVARPLPISFGWPGSQIVNLGRVVGWGNELTLDVRVLDRSGFSWDLGTQFSNHGNRIEDLGGEMDRVGDHVVGFSIADQYHQTVVHAELDADGRLVGSPLCDGGRGLHGLERGGEAVPCASAPRVRWGHSQPTWDLGVNSTFTVGPFRLYSRVDAVGGHYQTDTSSPANITSNNLTYLSNTRTDPITEAYKVVPRNPLGTYRAGFARLREVSLGYTAPSHLAGRIGASRASITVAARNLMMLWTAEHGWGTRRDGRVDMPIGDGHTWDPETRAGADLSTNHQTVMPPLASLNVTLRLSF